MHNFLLYFAFLGTLFVSCSSEPEFTSRSPLLPTAPQSDDIKAEVDEQIFDEVESKPKSKPKTKPKSKPKPAPENKEVIEEELLLNANFTLLSVLEDAPATSGYFLIDSDPKQIFKVIDIEESSLGELTIQEGGEFVFQPFANLFGEELLVFNVESENGNQSQNVLQLLVESVNDQPVVSPLSLTGKQEIAIVGKLKASDVDGDELSFINLGITAGEGVLELNEETGEFIFTPAVGFYGQATFFVSAFDGTIESEPAEVSLLFDKAPDPSTPFQVCAERQNATYPIKVTAFNIPQEHANMQFMLKNEVDLGESFGQFCMDEINIPDTHFDDGFKKEDGSSLGVTEWFALEIEAIILVKDASIYDFKIYSDDGAILYINDQKVIDNDGVHSPTVKNSADQNSSPYLVAGKHKLKIRYFQGPRHLIALQLAWKKATDIEFVQIPKESFFADKK